jgi:hypothetical protein
MHTDSDNQVLHWSGVLSILLIVSLLPIAGAAETENLKTSFDYKVQEDPFFTFAYPLEMDLTITSADKRNSYNLVNDEKNSIQFFLTSEENFGWIPLDETELSKKGDYFRGMVIPDISSRNLTVGNPIFRNTENLSSLLTSYQDTDNNELIYSYVVSTDTSVITAVMTEPEMLYNSEYGDFILKSLLSITPRDAESGFTLNLIGTDLALGEEVNTANQDTAEREVAYDPFYGLYYDTETGYYYLPQYGVFYDPKTGNYYYPQEFGSIEEGTFPQYTGVYETSGSGAGGYYDSLFSGYSGIVSGDTSDIINDVYTNRQETYDAANAMWSDYIRGDEYATVDESGDINPIDSIQEYQDSDLC